MSHSSDAVPPSMTGSAFTADRNVIRGMVGDGAPVTGMRKLIDRLEKHLIKHAGFDVYVRRRWDPIAGALILTHSRGLSPGMVAWMERVSMEDSLYDGHATGASPMTLVEDTQTTEATQANDDVPGMEQLRALGVRALCCLPLLTGGELAGTVEFGTSRQDRFTEEQRLWLETLAMLLATAGEHEGDGQRHGNDQHAGSKLSPQIQKRFASTLGTMRGLTDNLEERVHRRTQELANYHSQLRHLLSELVLTEQRERRRIAGELHDHLAQLLVACKMKLALVQSSIATDDQAASSTSAAHTPTALLSEIDGFLNESLTYTRNLVAQISPVLLYEQGLLPALRWLAEGVMPRHGLSVTVEIEEGNEGAGDRLEEDVRILLFQSVRELLFNVVKHAHTTCATLTVREHEDELEVIVQDDGAGFDREQVQMTGGSAQQGFGLLSIRERMTLLGGRLDLTSTPGSGTRASVRVPLLPMADQRVAPIEPPLTPSAAVPVRSAPSRGHIHVLVVDDHAVVREGLMMMLGKEEGLVIVGEAADGPTALELTRRLRPHVVLMDVGLPGIDGIETTRQLTATQRGVKVVGLSMHEDDSIAAAMRNAGAVDYLCKGCSPELLIGTIRRAALGETDKQRTTAGA